MTVLEYCERIEKLNSRPVGKMRWLRGCIVASEVGVRRSTVGAEVVSGEVDNGQKGRCDDKEGRKMPPLPPHPPERLLVLFGIAINKKKTSPDRAGR